MMKIKQVLFLALLALSTAKAQNTTFTYQGHLSTNGSPANGNYDFTFTLFNNSSTNTGKVGTTLTNLDLGVTNGLFVVALNFGNVFNGSNYWLAVGVRANGGTNFTTLNPLQEVGAVPYAIYAPNAGIAANAASVAGSNITGTVLFSQLPAAIVTNGESGVNVSGTFSGNGSALTNLTLPVAAAYIQYPPNWVAYGASWDTSYNGNTCLDDTNVGWIYQVMRQVGWKFTNYAVDGNNLPGNVQYIFTNAPQANEGTVINLVNNDVYNAEYDGIAGANATQWAKYCMAQLVWSCFATNDPGMFTALNIANTPNNGTFNGTWTKGPNPWLPDYVCTGRGTNLTTTNLYGTSIIIGFDGYTNGTSATADVYVDGNLVLAYDTTTVYAGFPHPTNNPEISYVSNSIPIAVAITGLTEMQHTVVIANAGGAGAANTNLGVVFVCAPQMHAIPVTLIAMAQPPQPGVGEVESSALAPYISALSSNVLTLSQCGLPAFFWDATGVMPYGPAGTCSSTHPSPTQYTNLANAFLQTAKSGFAR